jgi:hypothetical protein
VTVEVNDPSHQRRMRVEVDRQQADYIHNDLMNAAYFHRNRVKKRMSEDDRDGIFLDMMACLTMIAFAVEANLNFVGPRVVEKWNERDSSPNKFSTVFGALKIDPKYEERPYSSILKLRDFRNALAHGKPRVLEEAEVVVGTYDEVYSHFEKPHRSPWEEHVTLDFIDQAYEDMDKIWQMMLEKANIDVADTLSLSGRGMKFIEFVDGNRSDPATTTSSL